GTFLIADIDDFRDINERLGHQFGDAVLVGVAREIQEVLDDRDLAGRLGGDEFVIFIPRIADIDDIHAKTKAVMQAAQRTYFGDEMTYQITGSLGLARYPEHAQSFDTLYKAAGIALFESKSKGKNRCTFYSNDMQGGSACRRNPVEASQRFVSRYFEHDLIYSIFEMLYETKDLSTTLNAILELLGKQFELDRVYLFERLGESLEFRDVYEWCAEGIASAQDALETIPAKDFEEFLSFYNDDGMFCCSNRAKLDELPRGIVEKQNSQSFLQCGIYRQGEMRGFVGFDLCTQQRVWSEEDIATLSYVSRILSLYVLRK
ncbi:MAG: diguanylate cyclase, partial [Raoultibacter sp.]